MQTEGSYFMAESLNSCKIECNKLNKLQALMSASGLVAVTLVIPDIFMHPHHHVKVVIYPWLIYD